MIEKNTSHLRYYLLVGLTMLLLVIVLFLYRTIQQFDQSIVKENLTKEEQFVTIFDTVALSEQKNFKLMGEQVFAGIGFEPGFVFKMSVAGTKFGLELLSENGLEKHVGYLDLQSQSTSTKTFFGNLLDDKNKIVPTNMVFKLKKCIKPSGDEVEYIVEINLAKKKLSGCAELVK